MKHKHYLLLAGLLTALLISAGLVFARNYTTIKRLNITSDGQPITGDILDLNISANGRYLVYRSYDDNADNSGTFVYDLTLDIREEIPSGGTWAWVSNDGRYIFQNTLAPSSHDKGATSVYDRVEKTETIVGTGLNGESLAGDVWAGSMSPDGRYFVYYTNATNPFDGLSDGCTDTNCASVFLWDRLTNTQERISVNNTGEPALIGEEGSGFASISDDGNIVLFASDSPNLSENPLPCTPTDESLCFPLYVRDRAAGKTEMVTIAPDGTLILDAVVGLTLHNFDLSGNGRFAVFMSDTDPAPYTSDFNIYVRDILNNTTEMVNVDSNEVRIPNSKNAGFSVISNDGRFVMFIGGDELLYVRDRLEGITTVASKDANGNTGTIRYSFANEGSFDWSPAAMSAAGDTIMFISASDTLAGSTLGDTSEKIFVSQGEAIPPTSTPTDVPHTATAQPTDTASTAVASTATPQPSSTPSCDGSTELIINGSFEIAGNTANSAANWQEKRLVRSKRVQNKPDKTIAYSGDFAFQFKGIGRITQTVNSISGCGDVLTLSAWVEGRKLDAARVQAKVIYTNADPVKLRFSNEELNAGTYSYKPLSATLNLSGDVESIKVQISKQNSTGRLRIDDVSLSLSVDAARITLPIAQ